MNRLPKYPTDFVAMTTQFEDEDIENLLSQSTEDISLTIDILKKREVNATNALQNLEILIQSKKIAKEVELDIALENEMGALTDNLTEQIKLLDQLL